MNALNVITAGQNDYLRILDEAWQAHLAPRAIDAPTVVSLFAGCGGSSLGYSMAGYQELLAVEWDDHAVACFKLNFPEVPVYHGNITQLSGEEALRLAGILPGELDVLDGSPPCQGFSTAGKRILADPRNGLFREYVRLLKAFRPKAFVMENVSGMVKGKMKLVFAEIMRALKSSGYQVSARLMNAMYFQVPQSRARMIIVGIREDLGLIPTHPKPQRRPFTVLDAWHGLPTHQDVELGHCWMPVKPGSKTEIALSQTRPGGKVGRFGGSKRLDFNSPSGTIPTGGLLPGYPGSTWPSHPVDARGISMREGARLCSFPDGVYFGDDWQRGAKRIGNSVPPLFMRAIAQHVSQLLQHPIAHH